MEKTMECDIKEEKLKLTIGERITGKRKQVETLCSDCSYYHWGMEEIKRLKTAIKNRDNIIEHLAQLYKR